MFTTRLHIPPPLTRFLQKKTLPTHLRSTHRNYTTRLTMRDLLIVSLGNPSPRYDNTRHSAGHTLLRALARLLHAGPFEKASRDYARGSLTRSMHGDAKILLWQSPSYMNDSGPGVAAAWKAFCTERVNIDVMPRLVVLHDEIEERVGRVKVREGVGMGARGHNGLRSLLKVKELAGLEVVRVGVGIGPRPVSRDPDVVADYVLTRMSAAEVERVEGLAGSVWEVLEAKMEGRR